MTVRPQRFADDETIPVTVVSPDRVRQTVWLGLAVEPLFFDAGPPDRMPSGPVHASKMRSEP